MVTAAGAGVGDLTIAMRLSFRPLSSRLGSRYLGQTLEERARTLVEVSPAVRRYRPPAIALPGEVDRVRRFHEWTPDREFIRQDILRHLTEGEDLHPATKVMRIDDVLVADGCVYAPGAVLVITKEKRRAILSGDFEEVDEAQLCTTHCGSIYFGDWMMVDIPMELLAHRRGVKALSLSHQVFGHEPAYRQALQLPRPPRPESILHAKSLWIVHDNDRGMTEDRLARYHLMRQRVRDEESKSPSHVFIDRGEWGNHRGLRNREAVLASLSTRGFCAIYPEKMTVAELSQALSSAKVCLGIEGSAMCHASLMLPAGAAMLAIVPEDRFLTYLKWFTDAFGMRYGYVVGERPEPGASDVSIDLARLHAALDLIEKAV